MIASKVEMEKPKAKRFEGKVAIVTASTQGIGLAIAERLGFEGASIVISSRRQVLFISPFQFLFVFLPILTVFSYFELNYRSKMLTRLWRN